MKGTLKIGTSGIVLPGSKKTFPKEFQSATRLSYYSRLFNTVEINSTFYKLPRQATFEKWSSEVDEDFRFTCKLWKSITHCKSLRYQREDIDLFMKASNGIGKKRGCLLVQFPPSVHTGHNKQIEQILKHLTMLNEDPKWKICIEFRDIRWYDDDSMLRILEEFDVSIVLHDMLDSRTPLHLAGNPVYLRLHGPDGDYQGNYSDEVLASYASRIKDWLLHKDVYIYFNNTMGEAFKNAQHLKTLI